MVVNHSRDVVHGILTRRDRLCCMNHPESGWFHGPLCDDLTSVITELEAEVAELSGALKMSQEAIQVYADCENEARAENAQLRAQLDAEFEAGCRVMAAHATNLTPPVTDRLIDAALEARRKERG